MNFKKFKRLLSVTLSASMLLSTNMTALATEAAAPIQADSAAEQEIPEDIQLQSTEIKEATVTEDGITQYVSENGEIRYKANALTDETADNAALSSETPVETNAAQIGTEKYATLNEAFTALQAAAAGTTLKLLNNAVLDGVAAYNLTGKNIETDGKTIQIADSAKIKFEGGSFTNSVVAEADESQHFKDAEKCRTIIEAMEGSKLTISGGTYTTKGVRALIIKGDATVTGDAKFECNATAAEISNKYSYDGAVLLAVLGTGTLTMEGNAVINSDVGNADNNAGIYGIHVTDSASATLGKTTTDAAGKQTVTGPTVTSKCAAISVSGDAAVTVNGGTYTSTINNEATDSTNSWDTEVYNSVIILFRNAKAVVNNGTFKAEPAAAAGGATPAPAHVVALQNFSALGTQKITIYGGTFTAPAKGSVNGTVFYEEAAPSSQAADTLTNRIELKGGTFSDQPVNTYVANGYTAKEENSKWVVTKTCEHKANNVTSIKEVTAKDATCWEEGWEAHYACETCGQKFFSISGAEGTELSDSDVIIPKKSHEGIYVPAVTKETCTVGKHNAYYYCENCKQGYSTMMDLKANTNPLNDNEMGIKEQPSHDYQNEADWGVFNNVTEVADKAAFTALWNQFKDAFQVGENDPINVTVTSKCSECGEVKSDSESIIASVNNDMMDKLKTDCTTENGTTVTLTATLPEVQKASETVTHTVKIKKAPHSYKYIFEIQKESALAPTAVDENTVFDTSTDKIMVKRYCEYCGDVNAPGSANAAVTPTKADGTAITVGCFDQEMELKATAQFGANASQPETREGETVPAPETVTQNFTMTVKGLGHELKNQPYKEPSCFDDGAYSHYKCTRNGGCGSYFRNPVNVGQEDVLTENDFRIPAIDHNFSAPRFNWQDKNAKIAKATFTCLKCGATITRNGLSVDMEHPEAPANYSCTELTSVAYPVSVEFDRACVHTLKDENGDVITDAFGDPMCEYKEDEPIEGKESFKATFTGGVKDEGVIVGHILAVDSTNSSAVAWADSAPADTDFYDVTKGAKITLKCQNKNCTGEITVVKKATVSTPTTETEGTEEAPEDGFEEATVTVASGSSIQANAVTAFIKQEKNTAKTIDSTCTADGDAYYNISVKCKTDDGKDFQVYSKNSADELIELNTKTKATGHDFQVKSEEDVQWDSNQAHLTPEAPTDVRVTLKCSHNEHHTTNVIIKADNTNAFVAITDKENDETYGDLYKDVYQKRTCTKNGVMVWAINVPVEDGKIITNFNTAAKAASTPAPSVAAGTGEDTETPPENKGLIYLTKTNPATGHDYKAPVWDAKDFENNADKEVYYAYECQSQICDGAAKDIDGVEFEVGEGNVVKWSKTENGKTIRRVSAALTNNYEVNPTCTKPGRGTTVGNVTINGKKVEPAYTHTGTVPALGHAWGETVTWGAFKPDLKDLKTVTIGEKDYQVPNCSITGERECTRTDCDDPAKPQNATSTLVTKDTEFTPEEGTIEIKATAYNPAGCETDGSVMYEISYYGSLNSGNKIEKVATRTETVVLPKTNHNYSNEVTLNWEEMSEEPALGKDGKPLFAADGKTPLYTGRFIVPAYRVCANDKTHHDDVPVVATVTAGCTENEDKVTFTAAFAEDYEPENGVTLPDEKTKTETFENGHALTRIEASTSNNCMDPSYEAHYHCQNCGKNYSNRSAAEEIKISYEAQNHTYGNPVRLEWIKQYEIIQAVFECSRCHSKDSIRTFDAQIDPNETYIEGEQTCEHGATAYYSVNIDLSKLSDKALFSKELYALEEMVELPKLDRHNIVDGTCTWCKASYVRLTFTGVNSSDIISEKDYLTTAAAADIVIPTAPNRFGYTFKNWALGEKTYATEAEKVQLKADIITLLAKKAPITVQANYEAVDVSEKGKVTVAYVDKDGNELKKSGAEDSKAAAIGENCTVTAANELTVSNAKYYFSHWANADKNVLGTGLEYQVYVQSAEEITVYAVYVSDPKDKEETVPAIAMTNIYASVVDGANKVSFTATLSIPDGYTRLDSGILYGTSAAVFTGEDAENNVVLNSGNTKIKVCAIDGDKTNTLSVNVGSVTDRPVFARGYLRYRNEVTGETNVVYTKIVSGIFGNLYEGN